MINKYFSIDYQKKNCEEDNCTKLDSFNDCISEDCSGSNKCSET